MEKRELIDTMTEEKEGSSEYGRPRRPTPETVSYLNGLPLDEFDAAQQAKEYVEYFQKKSSNEEEDSPDEPPEYPPMLSATHAALSSVFREFASLACEEIPSGQIETLVRIACRYSLVAKRIILAGMSSYWVFLSTHRFGSHVAQTVLRCVVAECEVNLDEFNDGQEECEGKMVIDDSYGSLLEKNEDGSDGAASHSTSKFLLQSIEELKQYANELAEHVCGSHVVRTSLCILSGVEFVDAFAPPGSTSKSNNMMGEWDTGVLAATRRGKLKDKKKKKKKRFGGQAASTEEDKGGSPQAVTVLKAMKVILELQSDEFHKDAEVLMNEMVGIISLSDSKDGDKVQKPGELQQRTCHPSAGPLLVQILRLLSYRDFHAHQEASKKKKSGGSGKKDIVPDRRLLILPQEPTYSPGSRAESLVHSLLCWDATIIASNDDNGNDDGEEGSSSKKQPYASDIIYGLSGEPRGSILLETIFRCCPDSFHDALCTVGGFYNENTLREYIRHGVSNFVVQALLMSARDKDQVSRMVKVLCGIVEDGSILKAKEAVRPKNDDKGDGDAVVEEVKRKPNIYRMGIVWRTFEMCATKGSLQHQEQILSALLRGYATIATSPEKDTSAESNKEGGEENKKRKKRSKAKGLSVDECIPHLLGLAPGTYEGEEGTVGNRLALNAAGARTLFHILHFKERLRTDWVKGILRIYGREDFVMIANDGLGSRW